MRKLINTDRQVTIINFFDTELGAGDSLETILIDGEVTEDEAWELVLAFDNAGMEEDDEFRNSIQDVKSIYHMELFKQPISKWEDK
ncbi:MAG: hypothetical protein AB7Q00_14730 [Phycisphaerales bacterium]